MMSAYHPALLLITSLTCLGLTPSAQGRGLMSQPSTDVKAIAPEQMLDAIPSEIATTANLQGDRSLVALNREDPQIGDSGDRLEAIGKSAQRIHDPFPTTTATVVPPEAIASADPLQIAQEQEEPTTEEKKTSDSPKKKSAGKNAASRKDLFWLLLLGLGTLVFAGIFAGAFYLLTRSGKEGEAFEEEIPEDATPFPQPPQDLPKPEPQKHQSREGEPLPQIEPSNGYNDTVIQYSQKTPPPAEIPPPPTEGLALRQPPALAKIDPIEKAIEDLQSRVPGDRRKAIWELGQQGDSRAVQPLVNLLMDSDSKQRSLILAALAEIGNRTLQPMNRALVLSLQDPNPDVRKNAIRDLTRVYDLVSQTSQMLRHAVDDSDPEVREAAKWALSQLSRIRATSNPEPRSPLQNWSSPSDNYPEEIP